MMANLRLYRDFYSVVSSANSADTYTSIEIYGLTATTYVYGGAQVEVPPITNEQTGRYYVEMSPMLYTLGSVYELRWDVLYNQFAPNKRLSTLFKFNATNIAGILDIEVLSPVFGIDINMTSPKIDIEVK